MGAAPGNDIGHGAAASYELPPGGHDRQYMALPAAEQAAVQYDDESLAPAPNSTLPPNTVNAGRMIQIFISPE